MTEAITQNAGIGKLDALSRHQEVQFYWIVDVLCHNCMDCLHFGFQPLEQFLCVLYFDNYWPGELLKLCYRCQIMLQNIPNQKLNFKIQQSVTQVKGRTIMIPKIQLEWLLLWRIHDMLRLWHALILVWSYISENYWWIYFEEFSFNFAILGIRC